MVPLEFLPKASQPLRRQALATRCRGLPPAAAAADAAAVLAAVAGEAHGTHYATRGAAGGADVGDGVKAGSMELGIWVNM